MKVIHLDIIISRSSIHMMMSSSDDVMVIYSPYSLSKDVRCLSDEILSTQEIESINRYAI